LSVDDEDIDVSEYTIKKIYYLMANIEQEPAKREKDRKISDAKTRLSAYNLPDDERKKIEDTDTFFQ